MTKRITIDTPDSVVILAARHLDETEGPVQIGDVVTASTRGAINQVLNYIANAHNTPAAVPPADRAAEATAEHHVVDGVKYLCHAGDHYCPAEPHRLALSEALGLGTSAPWDAIRERAAELAGQAMAGDDEGDELVCVDECGSCDACGMEPFGTPAEGWREAARFLRSTARASGNRRGALHGARLIETELRRLAAELHNASVAAVQICELPHESIAEEDECERQRLVTPCGPVPDSCDSEGDRCRWHEREQAHAEGEHAFCGDECETVTPTEPDNPAAYALARHIADHPMSTVQAAFRYLNAPVTIELHEDPATKVCDTVGDSTWQGGEA